MTGSLWTGSGGWAGRGGASTSAAGGIQKLELGPSSDLRSETGNSLSAGRGAGVGVCSAAAGAWLGPEYQKHHPHPELPGRAGLDRASKIAGGAEDGAGRGGEESRSWVQQAELLLTLFNTAAVCQLFILAGGFHSAFWRTWLHQSHHLAPPGRPAESRAGDRDPQVSSELLTPAVPEARSTPELLRYGNS